METWSWLVTAFVAYKKSENYVKSMDYGLIFLPAEVKEIIGFNDSLDFETHSSMMKPNQN